MSSNSVALLVPIYNAERFLARLADQVAAQSRPFDEVILYDDASTDRTCARASELAETFGWTIIAGQKNKGPGGARNRLAASATSEWIHFHDVDDELDADYLEAVLPCLGEEVDCLFHDVAFIDEVTREPIIDFKFRPCKSDEVDETLLKYPMGCWGSVIRRASFDRIGGFSEEHRCFEDGDLHFRLALETSRIVSLPRVLSKSLRHNEGVSFNQKHCAECRLEFLKSYLSISPSRLHDALGEEFEKIANSLVQYRNVDAARSAIQFANSLGRNVPTTKSKYLRLLAAFLPATMSLQIQHWIRTRQ